MKRIPLMTRVLFATAVMLAVRCQGAPSSGPSASTEKAAAPDFSGAENRHPRIVIHPELCGGRPVIRGTHVLVRNLVDALSRNQALWQIQEDFPDITAEDVAAAVAFIAEQALHL